MKEFIQFILRNPCYVWNKKNNISIKPTHIVIHSTATPGVMAKEWFNRWNKSSIMVAVHAFDLQIEILTQTIGQLYKDLAEIKAALIIERNRTSKLAQEIEQFSGKNVDTEELMK